MARPAALRRRLLEFALGLPGAWEDQPWEEDTVAKVGKKIFVFLGPEGVADRSLGVKLGDSLEQSLGADGAAPMGYGLGRAGWVTIPLRATSPPANVLEDWIEESYRLIAPKRLVAELDARPPRR